MVFGSNPALCDGSVPRAEAEGGRYPSREHLHKLRWLCEGGVSAVLASGEKQLREKLLKKCHLCRYQSLDTAPEEVEELAYGKAEPAANLELAEAFSAGLTLLDAASLSDSKDLYKNQKTFDYQTL